MYARVHAMCASGTLYVPTLLLARRASLLADVLGLHGVSLVTWSVAGNMSLVNSRSSER